MKPETAFIVAAVAAAAALVFWPRKAATAGASSTGSWGALAPSVGTGDASTIWTDQATARYRAQLAREMSGPGWEFL